MVSIPPAPLTSAPLFSLSISWRGKGRPSTSSRRPTRTGARAGQGTAKCLKAQQDQHCGNQQESAWESGLPQARHSRPGQAQQGTKCHRSRRNQRRSRRGSQELPSGHGRNRRRNRRGSRGLIQGCFRQQKPVAGADLLIKTLRNAAAPQRHISVAGSRDASHPAPASDSVACSFVNSVLRVAATD
ncbi:hypothetical protein NDU88_005126 [Pleurodeles waltl]|uniref:Uncharacterized protein n=1 Tax=Pleurodeles waltl TaxID=8319 RepID=A0AAV7UH41_PLEWA|nr:hypothetical protein NDU88_005126 [Pleurodeles waltl]